MVITLGNAVLLLFIEYLNYISDNYWIRILVVVIGLLLNFFLLRILLERFVFRKIKLIFKMIRDNKLTKLEKEQEDLASKSLAEVNEDVVEWAQSTQKELTELKSLETYRKNYVGNISHELKTPIFSIQGYLHTLLDGGLEDAKINRNFLERAAKNVDRLQSIVEDLETISRLESETTLIDKSKFDLKSLAEEVMHDLQSMANEKHIALIFKNGASNTFAVNADKEMMRQVLNNLIVNSIKYGKEGGTTKLSFYDMENQVLVEVSDDGSGIEEKHLKHLFDRFYRIETSRSRKIGGSGLGLSIVKHIIEAHKQSINVRSTPELGSTFGFTLDKG